jgi:hypothetical protein
MKEFDQSVIGKEIVVFIIESHSTAGRRASTGPDCHCAHFHIWMTVPALFWSHLSPPQQQLAYLKFQIQYASQLAA